MKILLVDEFPMVRAALTGLVLQRFPQAQVCGVGHADEARVMLQTAAPALVLLDLKLDGGLALLHQLHRDHPGLPVIVISGSGESGDALRALGAGARGYVPERSDLDTLAQALHLVLEGGTFVPPLRPGDVVTLAASTAADEAHADWDMLPLTPRQKVVLQLLTQGLSNKLIARELGVSVDTVKDHVAAVLKALGVSSRTQAVLAVTRRPAA